MGFKPMLAARSAVHGQDARATSGDNAEMHPLCSLRSFAAKLPWSKNRREHVRSGSISAQRGTSATKKGQELIQISVSAVASFKMD